MFIPLQPTPPDESNVIVLAGAERRRLRHDYLGSEHILLALVSERGSDVAALLSDAGLRRSDVVMQILEIVPEGNRNTVGRISVMPMARAVIAGASTIAGLLGEERVERTHYLLSILAEEDLVAVEIIDRLEVDRAALLDLVFDRLVRFETLPNFEDFQPALENPTSDELHHHLKSNELDRLTIDQYFARRRGAADLAAELGQKMAMLERKRQRQLKMLRLVQKKSQLEHGSEGRAQQRHADESLLAQESGQDGLQNQVSDERDAPEDRRSAQD